MTSSYRLENLIFKGIIVYFFPKNNFYVFFLLSATVVKLAR